MLEMPRSQFDKLMDEMKANGDDVASEAASFDEAASYSSSMESVESEGSEEFGEGADASRSSRYGKAAASAGGRTARATNQVKEIELSDDSEAENPWSDDLDFEEEEGEEDSANEEVAEVPAAASSLPSQWCRSSSLAVDHVAAGDIDGAVQLLHRQIGLLRVSALTAPMRRCFLAVQATTAGFPGMPILETPLQREGGLPRTILTLGDLRAEAKKGLKSFQGARFEDCAQSFREVFEIAPFVQVGDRGEESELAQYLDLAREYIIAVRLEQARQKAFGEIRTGFFSMAGNGRSVASGERQGFVKVVADGSGEILGVHMVGGDASEMIAEAAALMAMKATVDEVTERVIHPHPSYSEALGEACADVLGRSIHQPARKPQDR